MVQPHAFPTPTLDGVNGQLHYPVASFPGKETALPTEDWVSLRDGLCALTKRKGSCRYPRFFGWPALGPVPLL
jgi:hypothetical protein